MDNYFLVVTPGLENIAQAEAEAFGLVGTKTLGGVNFTGSLKDLYSLNLSSRVGSRVLVRVGQPFFARSDSELGSRALKLPWKRWIKEDAVIKVKASCSKSRLMHSGMVENIILSAIRKSILIAPKTSQPDNQEIVEVTVRLNEDLVTVSIDSSGELLHKRGYRTEVTRSPMRETLAAALILSSGWNEKLPLIDPFCGSGTIPIEAAMLASSIPPGFNRNFAFQNFPNFDQSVYAEIRSKLLPSKKKMSIRGYDRDIGAIGVAERNASRAGLRDDISFVHQAVSYLEPNEIAGHIITNPPYGERLTSNKDLRNLYAQLGKILIARFTGWTITLITNDPIVAGHSGLKFQTILKTNNGGIDAYFLKAKIG